MTTLKYSRQRESIKAFLAARKDHPTADTVYSHIREEYPNISLGTVYRNLSLLSELGEIRKISCDGPDRFDANTIPHHHFMCKKCGCVQDIETEEFKELNHLAIPGFDGLIEECHLDFYGLCGNCIKKS